MTYPWKLHSNKPPKFKEREHGPHLRMGSMSKSDYKRGTLNGRYRRTILGICDLLQDKDLEAAYEDCTWSRY